VQSLGRKKTDPRYGKGEHTLDLADDALIDEDELSRRILAAFAAPDYRPPTLPSTAMELLELSRNPEVGLDDVLGLLERDSMLAGRLLRLAQSPVYAGATPIQSLPDALMRLGLRTLRDMVLEVSMNLRVFKAEQYAEVMERVSRHSAAVANLSRLVARRGGVEAEYAFLCGLLHDVGVAGVLIALGDATRGRKPPEVSVIWPAVDRCHEQAAAAMAKLWKLPQEIPQVLGVHHDVRVGGKPHPLAAAICLADELANELGLSIVPPEDAQGLSPSLRMLASHTQADRSQPKTIERAREALRLDAAALAALRAEAERLAAQNLLCGG
jgi:putative nucleotidyltransferase with HDIG domain